MGAYDPNIRTLVAALRAERQQQHVSQAELEHRIGLARGHVEKWERGVRSPGTFYLVCWGQALGLQLRFVPISSATPGLTPRTE
jgi:transcriptional regulator with XRE-family HTH domain